MSDAPTRYTQTDSKHNRPTNGLSTPRGIPAGRKHDATAKMPDGISPAVLPLTVGLRSMIQYVAAALESDAASHAETLRSPTPVPDQDHDQTDSPTQDNATS